jgi:hypothetical protein
MWLPYPPAGPSGLVGVKVKPVPLGGAGPCLFLWFLGSGLAQPWPTAWPCWSVTVMHQVVFWFSVAALARSLARSRASQGSTGPMPGISPGRSARSSRTLWSQNAARRLHDERMRGRYPRDACATSVLVRRPSYQASRCGLEDEHHSQEDHHGPLLAGHQRNAEDHDDQASNQEPGPLAGPHDPRDWTAVCYLPTQDRWCDRRGRILAMRLGSGWPGWDVHGDRGQLGVGPRRQYLAYPRVKLVLGQPSAGERDLECVDHLLAVGVSCTQMTAAWRVLVSRRCRHGASHDDTEKEA